MYDAVIIGAGVSGSAAARELSRFRGNFCVLEKEEDVCCGTSKANSAIVHAGFDAPEGSLMAELNVEGNRMMGELSEELDFPFQRIGSLVICTDESDRGKLQQLRQLLEFLLLRPGLCPSHAPGLDRHLQLMEPLQEGGGLLVRQGLLLGSSVGFVFFAAADLGRQLLSQGLDHRSLPR